jgi:hypothetical protein
VIRVYDESGNIIETREHTRFGPVRLARLIRRGAVLLTRRQKMLQPPNSLPGGAANRWPSAMTSSQHVYEVRPRKDRRGFDLISDEDGGLPRSPLVNKGSVRECR